MSGIGNISKFTETLQRRDAENEASDAILSVLADGVRFVLKDPAWEFATWTVEMGRVMSSVEFNRKKGRGR